MLETWDWYWERFRDRDVLQIIERRQIVPGSPYARFGKSALDTEVPYESDTIAVILGRKKSSVERSLKRLFRQGKVERYATGWRLRTTEPIKLK